MALEKVWAKVPTMGRPANPEPLSPRRVLTAVCIPMTEYLDKGIVTGYIHSYIT